jgi:DNA-binding NtrC family response regulator
MIPSDYILIADDDQKIRSLLVRLVRNVAPHAHVIQATNGTEARAALQQYAFALIITDYHMPGASGLDILEAARGQDAAVPVIVVSARAQVGASVHAAGATAFFSKPFEIQPLSVLLRQVLCLP